MLILLLSLHTAIGSPPDQFSNGDSRTLEVSWSDTTLSELIREAHANNPVLTAQSAVADIAMANADISRGSLLPMVSLYSNWSQSPIENLSISGMPVSADAPDTYQMMNTGITANLPLDIFGANTFAWRATKYSALAAQGNVDAMYLTITTGVANAWYQLLTARALLDITRDQMIIEQQLLELVELRYKRGDASMLDTLQQRQATAAMEASLPSAILTVQTSETQLAALLGRNATETDFPEGVLPEISPMPAIGQPKDLLSRRPDLRSAQHTVSAAAKNQTAAWLSLAPDLSVSGSAGTTGMAMDDWNTADVWSVGMSASMPIFTGGMARAGVQMASANAKAADASLNATWITAIQEVETAINTDTLAKDEMLAAERQLVAATLAWNEAQRQYAEGIAPYLTVTMTNQAYRRAQMAQLGATLNHITSRIALYDALGAQIK